MDGYFCTFQESQGGETTEEILAFAWQVTPTHKPKDYQKMLRSIGKNNRFPFLDILGYLKNTHIL